MIPGSPSFLLLAGAAEAAGYNVERSLRFNSSDSAYLSKNFGSAGNRKTWTWAGWVKLAAFADTSPHIFGTDNDDANRSALYYTATNQLGFYSRTSAVTDVAVTTTAVYRDYSAWYHIVLAVDTNQATPANVIKIYVNGVEQDLTVSAGVQNALTQINNNVAHSIGRRFRFGDRYLDGYLADVHFIDGQALTPSSFGEFDADTGIWNPIAYTGSYGTNGFHLPFSDNSSAAALGYDAAGSNDWTVNNIATFPAAQNYRTTTTGTAPTPFSGSAYVGAFDGSTSTSFNWSPGTWTMDWTGLPSAVTVSSSLRIFCYPRLGTVTVNINGSNVASITGNTPDWRTISFTGTINTISFNGTDYYSGVYAIEVDGVILIDSTVTSGDDSLIDVPTNGTETDTGLGGEVRGNYATLNPLQNASADTFSNGNLQVVTNTSNYGTHTSTIATPLSGKWYAEVTIGSASSYTVVGLVSASSNFTTTSWPGSLNGVSYYGLNGQKIVDTSASSYGATFGNGDIIGIAYDADSGSVTFYKNGVSQGAITSVSVRSYYFAGSDYDGSGSVTYYWNFGQRPFAYDISIGIPDATGAIPILSTSDDYGQTLSSGTATDSDSANLVLALPMNGSNGGTTFTDYSATIKGSGTAKTATVNGNTQISTTQSKWYGSSAYFDGNGDYLQFANSTDFDFGTGDFTVECWIYTASNAGQILMGYSPINEINFASGFLYFNKSGVFSSSLGATISLNQWIHVAVVRSGSTVTGYVNGVAGTSPYNIGTNSVAFTTGTGTLIGRNHISAGTAQYFNGYINDVRVYKGTAKYTANFTPPSSALYKALCTANLPAPTVEDGSDYMDVALWTGSNTSAARTISGLNFSPDLVWAKARSLSGYSHNIYDIVRGTGKGLYSDSAGAEIANSQYGYISAFTSDGFTGTPGSTDNGFFNQTNETYVAWTWDAGSSTVSNTDGSITSSCRTNQSSGFSIATFTAPSSGSATIGHNLNAEPHMIIIKSRDQAYNWCVYHKALTSNAYFLNLNTTAAQSNASNIWNNTTPTSTVFSLGSGYAGAGATVAYLFSPVAGYSSFGSYTGNGSSDGPFVYTGFRPRYLLFKSSSAVTNWVIQDTTRFTYNEVEAGLLANRSDSEFSSGYDVDILSNGFKLRRSGGDTNASGATYVYAAFAENPFALNARAR